MISSVFNVPFGVIRDVSLDLGIWLVQKRLLYFVWGWYTDVCFLVVVVIRLLTSVDS